MRDDDDDDDDDISIYGKDCFLLTPFFNPKVFFNRRTDFFRSINHTWGGTT